MTRRELSTASRGVPTVTPTPAPVSSSSAAPARSTTPAWLPVLLGVLALALVAGSVLVGVRDVAFEAEAEYGWVVVQDVGDGSVTAVQDLDPEGPTIALDVPTTAGIEAGSRIAVRYEKDSPYDVVLTDRPSRLPLLLGAGLAGVVLAGIALGLALRVRHARAQLNRRG
ncbi:hypothetical protein Q760_08425 [Cellulomonas cellasea DSM 20118]|uniref:DUF3592 domain-containing protein n=1 Tax=Cellulomonas cellasea DSM 20118 TaxID=1408250 RepID=A0A0A0B5E9_9CELL|nr:hypothetical protein Q760_08425 [Cellulomonas cellasea DSM 20118]